MRVVLGVIGTSVVLATLAGCPARGGTGGGETATRTQTSTMVPRALSPTRTPEPARPIIPRAQMTRTPWRLARAGDWAIIDFSSGGRRKFVIREVTDERIIVDKWRIAADGTETRIAEPDEYALQQEEADFADVRTLDLARIEAQLPQHFTAGDFTVFHVVREYGGNRTDTFFCPEIPFYGGVIKSMRNGGTTYEFIDFGHAAGG